MLLALLGSIAVWNAFAYPACGVDYQAVGGYLGRRLELRGRTVYLWERPPSPTQRQTLFDCTY